MGHFILILKVNKTLKHLDIPITKDDDDKLGFKSLAEKVAKGILDYDKDETFIISIEGKWGSGKTSLMNLIENILEKENKTQSSYKNNKNDVFNKKKIIHLRYNEDDYKKITKPTDEDKIKIMHFNPWLLTNIEMVISLFFGELKVLLNDCLSYEDYNIVSKLNIFENKLKLNNIKFKIPFIELDYSTDSQISIENIKKEISELLKQIDKKIVIVIDDIDRLTDQETEFIFRLIKGIADFDKVIYILLYDKRIVAKSLNTFKQEDGEKYLEKIVQYPLAIPKPHKLTIQNLIISGLEDIKNKLKENNKEVFGSSMYMRPHVREIIDTFMLTIRDTNKIMNIMSFEYPIIAEDVNLTDFFLITILRIRNIKLYELIKESYGFEYLIHKITDTIDEEKEIKKDYMKILDIDTTYENILCFLFPILKGDTDKSKKYHNLKKISNRYYFENYFSFSISNDRLAYKDFIEIEKSLLGKNMLSFKKKFEALDNKIIFFIQMFTESVSQHESIKYENAFLNAMTICREKTTKGYKVSYNDGRWISEYMHLSHKALAKITNVDEYLLKFYKNNNTSLYVKYLLLDTINQAKYENELHYKMIHGTTLYANIEYKNETIEQISNICKNDLKKMTLNDILNNDYYSFNLSHYLYGDHSVKNISEELQSFMFKNNKNFFKIMNNITYSTMKKNKYLINTDILISFDCLKEAKNYIKKIDKLKLSREYKSLVNIFLKSTRV